MVVEARLQLSMYYIGGWVYPIHDLQHYPHVGIVQFSFLAIN